ISRGDSINCSGFGPEANGWLLRLPPVLQALHGFSMPPIALTPMLDKLADTSVGTIKQGVDGAYIPAWAPAQPDAAKRFPLAGVRWNATLGSRVHARHHAHRPTARGDAPRRLRAAVRRARTREDRRVARGHRPADADRPGLSRDARRPLQVRL